MRDIIIIGAGPAGITASIYAARQRLDVLLLTGDIGGQAVLSGDIENYTGFQFISGVELTAKFQEHLRQFSVDVREGEPVRRVAATGDGFTITTTTGMHTARCVIIASGRTPRMLNVPGEEQFRNRGVVYCAACDGPLFSGKDVVVIGGGNSGFDAALQLIKIARTVTVIEKDPAFRAEPVLLEKARLAPNIELLAAVEVREIFGDTFARGVRIVHDGRERDVPAEGVFIEIGSVPNASLAPDLARNKAGEIIIDGGCRTSIEGIFAAGDVTDVVAKQIIVACGEGAKALLSAASYLNRRRS